MNGSTTVSWTRALAELGVILRLDAAEAEAMLAGACEREPSRCRRCAGERLYQLSGGRLRCAKCRYSFYRFTGRWLGRHRLPAKVWLAGVKAFELGLGAAELAQVCELSLPTASELLKTIQMSLASMDPEWAATVRACDSGNDVPRSFWVSLEGEGFKVRAGAALEGGPTVEIPAEGPDSLRAFRAGIRRWARLPAERFALKLKEWELRSNTKQPIFELALEALVAYMPAGVAERKGGVTTVLRRHHHHHRPAARAGEPGLVIRQVKLRDLVPA